MNSTDSILEDKVLIKTHLDFSKTFPENGLTYHQELDEVGMTLVDW